MNATEKNESEFDFQFEFDFNTYRISSGQSKYILICETYKSIEKIKYLLVKAADAEKRRMEWLIEGLGVSGGLSSSLSDFSNSRQIEKLAIELDEKRKIMRSLLKEANL